MLGNTTLEGVNVKIGTSSWSSQLLSSQRLVRLVGRLSARISRLILLNHVRQAIRQCRYLLRTFRPKTASGATANVLAHRSNNVGIHSIGSRPTRAKSSSQHIAGSSPQGPGAIIAGARLGSWEGPFYSASAPTNYMLSSKDLARPDPNVT